MTLEEGENLQTSLQEALSHWQFLTDCLMPDLFEKLEKEGSETLKETGIHKALITKGLKVILSCWKIINILVKN